MHEQLATVALQHMQEAGFSFIGQLHGWVMWVLEYQVLGGSQSTSRTALTAISKALCAVQGLEGTSLLTVVLDDRMDVWPGNERSVLMAARYNYFNALLPNQASYLTLRRDEDAAKGMLSDASAILLRVHSRYMQTVAEAGGVEKVLAEDTHLDIMPQWAAQNMLHRDRMQVQASHADPHLTHFSHERRPLFV